MKLGLGKVLTTIGAAVGGFAAVAMAIKLKITLTPQMEEVVIYKGLFAACAVLLLLGAIIGRREKREALEEKSAAKELRGASEFEFSGNRVKGQEKLRER